MIGRIIGFVLVVIGFFLLVRYGVASKVGMIFTAIGIVFLMNKVHRRDE